MTKNIGENISKNISSKYSQKLLDHTNDQPQMHLKPIQKKQFIKQQKQLVI